MLRITKEQIDCHSVWQTTSTEIRRSAPITPITAGGQPVFIT
jgi:hypothetical protein